MARLTTHDDLQAGARWAPALRALGDERLARMVEGGSDPAFAAIYGRYAPILHGYCRSLLRDEDEAGDALQNSMLKALQAMRRAGRTGPLRPWLFRIAHNESVTILRARTRRPGPLDEGLVAGADDAFRRAVAREQLAALLADLEHLTEHQRGALVMRELGGLSYDEISQALETTPLAARQAVFVARKRLSQNPIAPRRLRPALRQLVPAPAGWALLSWLGSGSIGITGKALIGTAAAVSVGIGSVELAVDPPSASTQKRTVAAAPAPKRHRAARSATAATPAATAAPTRAVVRSTTSHRETTSTPAATFVQVSATVQPSATAEPEATRAPQQSQPEAPARDDDAPAERAPHRERAPAAQPPPPAAEELAEPPAQQPPHGDVARARGDCPHPDGPSQQAGPPADNASADGDAVQPVQ
jgi:RNA polymerase sigma factor (sigma-70 family)